LFEINNKRRGEEGSEMDEDLSVLVEAVRDSYSPPSLGYRDGQ
jgi:hypothetical protein